MFIVLANVDLSKCSISTANVNVSETIQVTIIILKVWSSVQ